MKFIGELFQVIGLLLSISKLKMKEWVENVDGETMQTIKRHLRVKRYLRVLSQAAIWSMSISALLLVCGFVFEQDTFFALAGIIICAALIIISLCFSPLVVFIQAALSIVKKKGAYEDQKSLAMQYVGMVQGFFLFICLITIYGIILPVESRPDLILIWIFGLMIFMGLMVRYALIFSGLIRFTSVIALIVLFVVSTMSLIMPNTLDSMKDIVPTIDDVWARDIGKTVTDLKVDKEALAAQQKKEAEALAKQKEAEALAKQKEAEALAKKKEAETLAKQKKAKELAKQKEAKLAKQAIVLKAKEAIYDFPDSWDQIEGWDRFSIKCFTKNPYPTNIRVNKGDTIIFYSPPIKNESYPYNNINRLSFEWKQFEEGIFYDSWVSKYSFAVTPEGRWFSWMDMGVYKSAFRETRSRRCFNLLYQLGTEESLGDLYSVFRDDSGKSMHIADTSGIVWLCVNLPQTSIYNSNLKLWGGGYYHVAVKVAKAA